MYVYIGIYYNNILLYIVVYISKYHDRLCYTRQVKQPCIEGGSMPGFCVLVGGEKGGTGKSTIATNLATMFTLAGKDTHLVDMDRQQTSLKFASRRASAEIRPPVMCMQVSGDQLHVPLTDLAKRYEVVIIDVGGQDSMELRSTMITPAISQMVIPVQAGFFDLETMVTMENLVRASKMYNPELNARCLINRAPTNKQVTVTKEAREFIAEELKNLGLFDTILHDRISYSYAVAKGECVIEYENRTNRENKASKEMKALFRELTGEDFSMAKQAVEEEQLDIEVSDYA